MSQFLSAFEISSNVVIVNRVNNQSSAIVAIELSKYIGKITKSEPLILSEYTGSMNNVILLKSTPAGKLKEDGFIIKSKEDRLIISAEGERGLIFGVYYFLEHYLGCKFLSKDYEYIPSFITKKLGEIYDKQEPRFEYRELFYWEGDELLFAYKNLLNGRLGHRSVENEFETIYTEAIHTHSFISSELIKDKYACSGQYDFGNSKARESALVSLRDKLSNLDKNRFKYNMLEHEDRGSFCTNGLNNEESASKPFLEYTRFLANNLIDEYPNDLFFYQAYLWSREVPKNVKKLPQNLAVHFAGIEADFSQPLNSAANRDIWNDLLDWGKLTDHVVIWHYGINFGGYMFPYPNLYALDRDIKDFSKLPFVKGILVQGNYGTSGGDLENLRLWIYAKLLWNPELNVDDLISEFCLYYYGDASKSVERYVKRLASFISSGSDKLLLKTSIDAKYLSNENLNVLDEILSDGLSRVKKESIYYKHTLELFAGLDFIRLLRGGEFKNKNGVKNRFEKYIENNPELTFLAEGVSIENILKIVDLNRTDEKIPSSAKGLKKDKDWLSFQEYQLELCCADIVEDAMASDGVSATMDGSSQEWGFSLPLLNIPKGVWDIYADVKVKKRSKDIIDNARWALRYGIHPTFVKGVLLSAQFGDAYKSIKIGTIDTRVSNAEFVWLSPPGNDVIEKVYVDRIYFIKDKKKFN